MPHEARVISPAARLESVGLHCLYRADTGQPPPARHSEPTLFLCCDIPVDNGRPIPVTVAVWPS